MPIRLRILLVALVAVLSVTAGFYREYVLVRKHAATLEAEQTRVAESMALSAVVHEVQKERGLTAGALADPSVEARERRELQRRLTDAVVADNPLASIAADGTPAEALARLRNKADAPGADWAQVRSGYTALIRSLLDGMAVKGRASEATVGWNPLSPLAELAMARENLGLARALLNRIYTRGRAAPSELADLAGYYGGHAESLHTFLRDIDENRRAAFEAQVPEPRRAQVLKEIEAVLKRGGVAQAGPSAAQKWWEAATRLIDGYKRVEDEAYGAYLAETQHAVEQGRRDLVLYGSVAVTATLLIAALTLFSLTRILSALGVLDGALHDVVEREDFGVRIDLQGRDEFGRIAASINGLLRYTGDIVRQKDVLASTDLLTQLSNRRHFIEQAGTELQRANRHGQRVALVMCDIDYFKSVNDRFGHARGDEVLRGFAALLARDRRASDLVARWGGEEFIILLSAADEGEALGLVERLRHETERLDFGDFTVTASFGVAYRRPGESLESVVKRADAALYRAKREGRNRVATAD